MLQFFTLLTECDWRIEKITPSLAFQRNYVMAGNDDIY